MRVTFLGTGTSVGVPRIACDCAVCASTDPRNQRLRCSLLLEHGDRSVLVDTPPDLRVNLLANSPNKEATVFRSKAVGEPPLMLGIAVWSALRDAVASLTDGCYCPPLDTPATPERMLNAVSAAKAWQAAQQEAVS